VQNAQMTNVVSKEFIVHLLKASNKEWEWLLSEIESANGWFRFPPLLVNAIRNLKIESYPLLYENEHSIARILLKAFMDDAEINEFSVEFEAASVDERGAVLESLSVDFDEVVDSLEIPKTPRQQKEANRVFDALSEEERTEAVRVAQHVYCFLFASFFQNLSMMVHGEKLTSLVAQAKAGNDDAYVKAVQIDRRILTSIPFFKERFERAQDEADSNFNDLIAYRLRCPPYQGKIRFKSLWMAFSFLDQFGWLDLLTHGEILNICDDAGVGGYRNRIEDPKYLSKRLAAYREFQQRGTIATY
jgi:hypothetical protein